VPSRPKRPLRQLDNKRAGIITASKLSLLKES
jgi:hypothetical protein